MALFFLLLLSELFFGDANPDLVNIGPYFWQPKPGVVYYEPGAVDPNGAWDQSLDPKFPTHGEVNFFFFKDNSTKTIRNCLRVLGGKTARFAAFTDRKYMPGQYNRWLDAYYCNQGIANFTGLGELSVLRFQSFFNGFDPSTDVLSTNPAFNKVNSVESLDTYPDESKVKTARTAHVSSEALARNTGPFAQGNTWNYFTDFLELGWVRDPADNFWNSGASTSPATGRIGSFGLAAVLPFWVATAGSSPFAYYAADEVYALDRFVPSCTTSVQTRDSSSYSAINANDIAKGQFVSFHYCLAENLAIDCEENKHFQADPVSDVWRNIIYLNFQSNCVFMPDLISVACLDPDQNEELALELKRQEPSGSRSALFTAIETDPWTAIDGVTNVLLNHMTHGYLQYQSLTKGMVNFINMMNHLPPSVINQFGLSSQTAGTKRIPSQASIWSILLSHLPGSTLGKRFFANLEGNAEWRDGWATPLGRGTPPGNVFMMNCPVAYRNNPGVNISSQCNMRFDNNNNCNGRIGRCFCDNRWLGIACDIPNPGLTYEQLTADPSDPYEICSTAGNFTFRKGSFEYPVNWQSSQLKSKVPVCSCIQGFEGTPEDFKSWVAVYASLFHELLTDRVAKRAGISERYFDTSKWFTHITHPSFDAAHNLISFDASNINPSSTPYGIKYDWYTYIMQHQCLIWTPPAYIPPMHVWWDYFSLPYILDAVTTDRTYEYTRVRFPWPSISTTKRNATFENRVNPYATGRQGIRCMDYRESSSMPALRFKEWNDFVATDNKDTKEFTVAKFVLWLQKQTSFYSELGVNPATLYGGPFCTPCPDCNRRNSVCVSQDIVYQCDCDPAVETCPIVLDSGAPCEFTRIPAGCKPGFLGKPCRLECQAPCRLTSSGKCVRDGISYHKNCTTHGPNVCQCDDNYCGLTCDTPMCPVSSRGSICGNGTCVIDPTKRCENLAPGEYGGFCQCNPGFNGTDCSNPICPLSASGVMCSGNPCNEQLGLCECPEMTAGPACELKGCPWANGLECAGAQRQDGGGSVCNRETQLCECFRTYSLSFSDSSKTGWPTTDSRVLLNARWGERCEYTFGDACRDPRDGSWCSQPISALGELIGSSDAYAGCYNETCDGTGAGQSCKPYCHCTLEFATNDPYCRKSVCGPERCGKGTCDLDCFFPGSTTVDTACTVTEVLSGKRTLDASCVCGVFNGTYYYHKHSESDKLTACSDPAPLCFTGSTSPCNGHGECAYNATSGTHFCICDSGYTGVNCSVAPACLDPLGQACTGPSRFCSKDNGHQNDAVCTCAPQYFRDANRTCTTERCVATGGTPTSDGCNCPESRVFYSDPPLERIETTHRKLGCRKGCPLFEGIPCGAYLSTDNSSRCSDLMANDPIFWDDPRPAPNCSCFFRGRDHMGHINYWIPDQTGACRPKCYPEGLCSGLQCPSIGNTLNPDNSCNCAPGFEGENCTDHKCPPGHSHHMGDGVCMCMSWCMQGDTCETDLCQATGGRCPQRGNDCQCSEINPVLKLDSSSRLSQRFCTSACMNGGYLNPTNTSCICPAPYYGPLCELTQGCNVQWGGTFCNVSNCVNGVPLPNDQSGCVCSDSFYRGVLCDQDLCTIANRRQRVGSNCTCALSFVAPDCTDPCLPGGTLDTVSNTCSCFSGYTWNGTACQPPSLNCSFVGTPVSTIQGGQQCLCPQEYSGSNCEVLTCLPPYVSSGRNRCSCPAGSYGPDCSENYCDSLSIGYNSTLGACVCPNGYRISDFPDGSGVRQCVPDPFWCSMFGTRDWSNESNPLPCRCKTGWSGTHCSSFSQAVETESSSLSPVVTWSIGGGVLVVIVLGIIIGVVFCRSSTSQVVVTKSRHKRGMY